MALWRFVEPALRGLISVLVGVALVPIAIFGSTVANDRAI